MNRSIKEMVSGSLIGMVGKIIAAALNFVSLPLIIALYGKANSGLIGIAMTTNAFLQIVNMGVPMGAVKFFSEWIESKNFLSLRRGMQTNLFFFSVIGLINSGVLVYLGYHAERYFNVTEVGMLRQMIYIIAVTSFINWVFTPIQHMLLAFEKISAVNFSNAIVSIANFVALLAVYFTKSSLVIYFLFYSLTNLANIPVNLYSCYKLNQLKKELFYPKLWRTEFRIIMSYSFGLFGMMIIQYMANQFQPIILSTMAHNGDLAVADYTILKKITMLVSMLGGIFLQSFMPYMSKANNRNDKAGMQHFIVNSTKWLSIFIFFICFFIAFNAQRIITGYVGRSGEGLGIWLAIWMMGLLFLNNQSIGSLILSVGKFRGIIIALLIASVPAIVFSVVYVNKYGVGIAAISFLIYKVIESFYIFGYFLPRSINVSGAKLFQTAMLPPLLVSIGSILLAKLVLYIFVIPNNFVYLIVIACISSAIYLLATWSGVMNENEKRIFGNAMAAVRLKLPGMKKIGEVV